MIAIYPAQKKMCIRDSNKVGIDKYIVHAALNHIDDSMKVTDIYICLLYTSWVEVGSNGST